MRQQCKTTCVHMHMGETGCCKPMRPNFLPLNRGYLSFGKHAVMCPSYSYGRRRCRIQAQVEERYRSAQKRQSGQLLRQWKRNIELQRRTVKGATSIQMHWANYRKRYSCERVPTKHLFFASCPGNAQVKGHTQHFVTSIRSIVNLFCQRVRGKRHDDGASQIPKLSPPNILLHGTYMS